MTPGARPAAGNNRAAWLDLPDTVPIDEAVLTKIAAELRRASDHGEELVRGSGGEAEVKAVIFLMGTQPLIDEASRAIASVAQLLDRGDERPPWLDQVARALGSGLERCRAIRLQLKALVFHERVKANVALLRKTEEEGEALSSEGRWLTEEPSTCREYCDRASSEIQRALLLLRVAEARKVQKRTDAPDRVAATRHSEIREAIDQSTDLTCSIAEHMMVLDWGSALLGEEETARADQAIEDDLGMDPSQEVRAAALRFFARPSRGIKIQRWRHELRRREGNLDVELPDREKFRSYMKRCVHGILRDNRRRGPAASALGPPTDHREQAEMEERLSEALVELGVPLSQRQHQVLVATTQTGSIAAAARQLGISPSSARTHYQRAVAKLRSAPGEGL